MLIFRYIKRVEENTNRNLQPVLHRILYLSALHLIQKHAATFYQGGYFNSPKPLSLIQETILHLCSEIKNDAIALVDAIAPPDYVLNSPLGVSNGDVYNTLYSTMIQSPGAFDRLSWYDDFIKKASFGNLKSKI